MLRFRKVCKSSLVRVAVGGSSEHEPVSTAWGTGPMCCTGFYRLNVPPSPTQATRNRAFWKWQLSRWIQWWKGPCFPESQSHFSILSSHKIFFTLLRNKLYYLPFHHYQPPVFTICIVWSEACRCSRENDVGVKGKNDTMTRAY